MHHLKAIRDLKTRYADSDFLKTQMIDINRKQVFLCQEHHIKVHRNTLTGNEKATICLDFL